MKGKRNKNRALMQQLGIENRRGDTFVGFRPTTFNDKSKYNRQMEKKRLHREIYR